ncbi:hypothetical protein U1Q18_009705, partial [Sarracenia purpurea var. burkii]
VAATVKLLLKLIQDHREACSKEQNDSRIMLRVAGMLTVLDNVRSRIQKSQSSSKKREAELRRCNTDLLRGSPSNVPRDKRTADPVDEKEKLRRDLSASSAARKSLEAMCSSLGKEKEIMAAELARKAQELSGMEELVEDLRAQNETLLAKVQECAAEHRERKPSGGGGEGSAALQERNKALSEQLLRSIDAYRSVKRRLKEAVESNAAMSAAVEEIRLEAATGLERIREFKQRVAAVGGEAPVDVEEEISGLEEMFECFRMKVSKHGQKIKGECIKPRREISACKPHHVLA